MARQELKIPPGLIGDDTSLGAKGRWRSGSLVRFREGRPEADGGWESLVSTLLSGVCRAVFPWTDEDAVMNIAFGTHATLELWQGGETYDITPYGPPVHLASGPLTTANGTAVVTVAHVAHGYTTGLTVKVYGAVAVGGIAAGNLNGDRIITVTGADAYTFTAGGNASSTATGGGTAVVITPESILPEGPIDGTGSAGFGTGAYGIGPYGITSPTSDYFPRTWSLAAWEETLVASPRGGGLYQWSNDTSAAAVAVDGAPTQITYMLVAPMNGGYQCFALGCEDESGNFNPLCIRHSKVRDLNEWSSLATGSTARQYFLTGGGRIVAGRMCGNYLLVWTTDAMFLGTFVGSLNQPWRFDRVGRNCGLIGPNAAIVVGQRAFWIGPDSQHYSYSLGGEPLALQCDLSQEFIAHLAVSQGDKIVASYIAAFNEIRWDYPDSRDGYENSRFIRMCLTGVDAGAWSQGIQARTAYVGEGPTAYPIGTTYEGEMFYHERGLSAEGGSFPWYIESAAQYLDSDWRMLIRGVWPDFSNQTGAVTVTLTAMEQPQGTEAVTTSTPMAPGQAKADLLASGHYFRIRFSGESAPTSCRIGTPVFDVTRMGMAGVVPA